MKICFNLHTTCDNKMSSVEWMQTLPNAWKKVIAGNLFALVVSLADIICGQSVQHDHLILLEVVVLQVGIGSRSLENADEVVDISDLVVLELDAERREVVDGGVRRSGFGGVRSEEEWGKVVSSGGWRLGVRESCGRWSVGGRGEEWGRVVGVEWGKLRRNEGEWWEVGVRSEGE